MNSTHKVEVIQVKLGKHDNADSLSVVPVWGYTCVVRTSDWTDGCLAAWIPPDSLVDCKRPEFGFLAKDARSDGLVRVKAKKLRGVLSFGLLVPAPPGAELGQDVTEALGVVHYDPEVHGSRKSQGGIMMGGEVAKAPNVYFSKYDLEAGRRYAVKVFVPGEPVVAHEKVHGAFSMYVFSDGMMHASSRTEWKKEYPDYSHLTLEFLEPKIGRERAEEVLARIHSQKPQKNMWWQALDNTPALRAFCEANPGMIVCGEVYGAVQDLNYGHKKGEVSFAGFDIRDDGRWLDWKEARDFAEKYNIPWVPLVTPEPIPFDFDHICNLAEGKSLFPGADHIREGVVVRPIMERWHPGVGRVVLKWVSAGYLERS